MSFPSSSARPLDSYGNLHYEFDQWVGEPPSSRHPPSASSAASGVPEESEDKLARARNALRYGGPWPGDEKVPPPSGKGATAAKPAPSVPLASETRVPDSKSVSSGTDPAATPKFVLVQPVGRARCNRHVAAHL